MHSDETRQRDQKTSYVFCLLKGVLFTVQKGRMAGIAGFEPAHDEIKTRCLTAWRYPRNVQRTDRNGGYD